MSDPRLDRDLNRPYANRESTAGTGSIWVVAIVAVLVMAGIAAYSYRGSITASNEPATTTGQMNRAPVSSPPVSATPESSPPLTAPPESSPPVSAPPAATAPAAPDTPADPQR
jgi:hypothetical protein